MIGDDEFWRQLRAAEARALEAERTREADEEWALEERGLRVAAAERFRAAEAQASRVTCLHAIYLTMH